MKEKWTTKPSRRYCRSCGKVLIGFRNEDGVLKLKCPVCGLGVLKLKCPVCGLEEVGRIVGRRHERCDFYAPPGNDIDN